MKEIKENKVVIVIILMSIIFAVFFNANLRKEYQRFNAETIHYVKAEVTKVISEDMKYDENLEITVGRQEIVVTLKEGDHAGEEITLTNDVTPVHHVEVQEGTKIIINADTPENIEPYYSVYNYDRTIGIFGSVILLIAIIVGIGRGKGVKAVIGLLYSLYIIVDILLPAIFSGYSPILMSVVVGILSTLVALLLLNGESMKTYGAIISTIAGVLISLVCFYVFSFIVHINGFSSTEIEGLILIGQNTGLQIKDVLFAGVLVSSLGAIMDTGLSIVSSLYEVKHHKPDITTKELFTSGIEIGKDMIGTMSNTLILAFTGSALVSLLAFLSYGLEFNQLLNSNYLTIEIIQGVCGTLGIVLTVPIASIISATLFTKQKFEIESKTIQSE